MCDLFGKEKMQKIVLDVARTAAGGYHIDPLFVCYFIEIIFLRIV